MAAGFGNFAPPKKTRKVVEMNYYANSFWAPGVHLLSKFTFGMKALFISIALCIPLGWVGFAYYMTQYESYEFSRKELLGVQYARSIFPVLELSQQLRFQMISGGVDSVQSDDLVIKLQSANQSLSLVDKQLGSLLGTEKAYAAVQDAFAASTRVQSADAFKAQSAFVEKLEKLIQVVMDNSNLTLDPDIDSFYLMDSALSHFPGIIENAGLLRDVGLLTIKSGSATAEQQRNLHDAIPVAEVDLSAMENALAKAYAYNSGLQGRILSGQAISDAGAFLALARKSVVNGREVDANVFVGLANKAIDAQHALGRRILVELDGVIAKRVDGIVSKTIATSVILLIGVFLAGYLFLCFYFLSNASLSRISSHLHEISKGDLRNFPSDPLGTDEGAIVLRDMQTSYSALHILIKKIKFSADALNVASDTIATASSELSSRTESAAANLEQQAAAMEEIGSTVAGTAERSKMASAFASDNAVVATRGGQVFGDVVVTMQQIQKSSTKIEDIIGVINGIAFQTNILALNAAVEAARAGESGRGFAVVASEVRMLAGRSAEAAREIKTLIEESLEKVKSGTGVVQEAGRAMQEVVSNANQINQFLNEISVACHEQARGVEEVGSAIHDLDQDTQRNSMLVVDTASAAHALAEQANVLQAQISKYQVA